MKISPNYVTDDTGKRTAVLLPIKHYESLMEDLQDLAAIADRRDEPTVSHADFLAELKADGILQD
jgi:PHD/YefM family antitoxin component YafN of YafNO toxin-antitoxin module